MTIKKPSNAQSNKYLRVHFSRNVQQRASTDILLSVEEYIQLKNDEIKPEVLVKSKFGENMNLDYTSVGWIETGAEKPTMEFSLGTWNAEKKI